MIGEREHLQMTEGTRCPNCGEWGHVTEGECYSCGFDGHCVTCREVTDFADGPDLRYCSDECARLDEHERRFP